MLRTDAVEDWPLIPSKAFLFFPTGNQIKEGKDEKQWRKIFEDGSKYDDYQEKQLNVLDKKLEQLRIVPHEWFDKANKLRFLQANKFKIEDTCKSIKEGSQWRQTSFPLKKNPQADAKLNQGTLYFCGRDRQYRPILIVQITKMKKYSKQIIPVVLNNLLEFALDHLLIPGQVQNYILMINLDDAGISDKDSVSKIVSFTSNTYRSRLYASYLLNTPFLIASGWNAFASAIVSENTLRKIKISKQSSHEDMWKHIDKEIVQQKYGGTLPNIKGPYWPPSQKLMNYTSSNNLKHASKEQYNKMFKQGKLKNRKVKRELLYKQAIATPKMADRNQVDDQESARKNALNFESPAIKSRKLIPGQRIDPTQILPRHQILQQIMPPIRKRTFHLFFEEDIFKDIRQIR